MKKTLLPILLIAAACFPASGKDYPLSSPNGEIQITLSTGDTLSCQVAYKGMPLFEKCHLQLLAEGKGWEHGPHVAKARRESVDERLKPLFPLKKSSVRNHYNQLQLLFKGGYGLELRAFDNGIAYWKSHATLTLLAKQDLPTFGYNMIDPLKSWCWGAILFYPFKISRFS